MMKFLALIVGLLLLVTPITALASDYLTMDVILGAGGYLYANHWQVQIDTDNTVPSIDTTTTIVAKESAYLDPTGTFPYIEYGNISDYRGSTQYFYTRSTSFSCIAPYQTDFGGHGCKGAVNQWNVARNEMATYEAHWYPASNQWEFFVVDLNKVSHAIAVEVGGSNAFDNPKVSVTLTYSGRNQAPVYAVETYVVHPMVWVGGGSWRDTGQAAATSTNSNHADDGWCPNVYSINQLPDQRSWFVTQGSFWSTTGPTCNANPFFPR